MLFGVSLEVEPAQLVCVMGRNGVGKTTLLNTVMGVLPATAGSVTFEGRDVTRLPPHERVRLGMAYVPQGHESFPQLSVLGNLQVTLEASGGPQEALEEALETFPGLKPLLKRRAGFLSGGQQQQLAIARALVTRPKLLSWTSPPRASSRRSSSRSRRRSSGCTPRACRSCWSSSTWIWRCAWPTASSSSTPGTSSTRGRPRSCAERRSTASLPSEQGFPRPESRT